MATFSGTANGAGELWTILLDAVTDNGWHIIDQGTGTDGNFTIKGVQLRGEDLAGDGNIYVHLRLHENAVTDVYAFSIEGSAGYLPSSDVLIFGQNPQNSYRDVGTTTSVTIYVPLHSIPIQYWITVSPRRFMGAFRHNDRWGAMYCGFVLPYGMPSQWAYPLWVAGNNITTMDYKTITSGCPWGASAVLSGMLYTPSGKWLSTPIANTGPGGGRGYGVTMWPYSIVPANSHLQYYYPLKDKNGVPRYSLFKPMLMCANANDYGVFGEPDGLDFASSFGAAGGDILDFNGKKYLLIQREMSTANQTSAAMLLE